MILINDFIKACINFFQFHQKKSVKNYGKYLLFHLKGSLC